MPANITDILGAILGGGAALGGGFLTKEALDRLSNIGEESQRQAEAVANQAMNQTRFQPFGITSATGGGFRADRTGTSMYLSPQEQAIQSMLMGQAGSTLSSDPYGQAMGRTAAESAYGLGQQFMGMAGQDTAGREADIYQRIRAMQSPEEQRQQMVLEERLANQGRLGVQTNMFGGTPEQLALSKAQSEAQNQAALMAMQQAQQQQAQQAQLGQEYTGLGSQLAARDLASLAGQQQLGLGALGGSYAPQAQMLNVMQASELYPQLAQRGQLMGAQMYGEGMMTGIEGRLISEQTRADLLGDLGAALLGGGLFGGASGGGLLESIIGIFE
jgi:hypothetical protein